MGGRHCLQNVALDVIKIGWCEFSHCRFPVDKCRFERHFVLATDISESPRILSSYNKRKRRISYKKPAVPSEASSTDIPTNVALLQHRPSACPVRDNDSAILQHNTRYISHSSNNAMLHRGNQTYQYSTYASNPFAQTFRYS